jgi:hypothetical protein
MARALHLLKGEDPALALATIAAQLRDHDTVTVVLLHGAPAPALPAGVAVRRLSADLTHGQLLELIFASDRVIAW